MGHIHIVGAGLAGLASAVELVRTGGGSTRAGRHRVTLYETASQAGGRCRSYFDETLGRIIDNGNHLLMSANRAARAYLEDIGAEDTMWSPPHAAYPFLDLETGERWTLAPNHGIFPRWIFDPARRVAGTRPHHYLGGYRLPLAGPDKTVAQCLNPANPLYKRFWEPLCVAALNTAPERGAAKLLWRVLAETFAKGGAGCVPMIARDGLGASLVDPALKQLTARGVEIHFNTRLRVIETDDGRAAKLVFSSASAPTEVALGAEDRVILALPPTVVGQLMPEIEVPRAANAIVNAHFRVAQMLTPPGEVAFLGLVGGHADWLFSRGDIVSVTVSGADALAEQSADHIERILWRDTAQALGLEDRDLIAGRIIKEKRATFAQTPSQNAMRPGPRTRLANLVLAGDWTDTGLPASIEGTIRSAKAALACLD